MTDKVSLTNQAKILAARAKAFPENPGIMDAGKAVAMVKDMAATMLQMAEKLDAITPYLDEVE